MGEQGPEPTLRPTGWQTVGVAAVVGAGLGWLLFSMLDLLDLPLPALPLAVVATTAVLAVFTAIQAWGAHRTIQVRHDVPEPGRAVRLVVLGKPAYWSARRWPAAMPRLPVILFPDGTQFCRENV